MEVLMSITILAIERERSYIKVKFKNGLVKEYIRFKEVIGYDKNGEPYLDLLYNHSIRRLYEAICELENQ
jgi:hypothetical protein